MNTVKTLAAIYMVIAIITFGAAAGDQDQSCRVVHNDSGSTAEVACIAVSSVTAALVWPLYWSWELQKEERKEHETE